MKKKILALAIAAFALVFTAALQNDEYTHVIDSAKLPQFNDLAEVLENSDLIVMVEKVSDTPVAYELSDDHYDNLTLSTVKISKVIKPMDEHAYSKGDTIQVLESEWVDEENKIIHHVENYAKMGNSKKYVLCLGYNPSVDNFYPIGLLYGKIPLDKSESPFYGEVKNGHVQSVLSQMKTQFVN